jgi:23S rRNA (adenine2503-C2)-methyltransferase
MPRGAKKDLLGLLPEAIDKIFLARGIESYRSGQVLKWLYEADARSADDMTNLPKKLREELASEFSITNLEILQARLSRKDGTEKLLLGLADGEAVEAVFLPEGKRGTLCVSTQVGCSFGCSFCASGKGGLKRNLTTAEIVDQARRARFGSEGEGRRLTNIVLMGMGEPLANYEASADAVRIFQHERCFALGKRRVTISTAGYVPGIRKLARDDLPVRLAVSLHAPDDKTRSLLMPINKKFPIKELMEALKPLSRKTQTPLTIEYMLVEGINNSLGQARALARICRSLDAKVNLLSYNPALAAKSAQEFAAPGTDNVLRFQAALREQGVLAFIRRSRGLDIEGACGQLRAAAQEKHKSVGEA